MVRGWYFAAAGAVTAVVLLLSACKGDNGLVGGDPASGERAVQIENPFPPCTDPDICCPAESLVRLGSPDNEKVVCLTLWTCDDPSRPYKCWSALPVPSGTTDWECSWSESTYVCKGKTAGGGETGTSDGVPGGALWDCQDQATGEFTNWTCTYAYPPNPGNNPAGTSFYECETDSETDKLECEPKSGASSQGSTPSGSAGVVANGDSGAPSGPGFSPWQKSEEGGKTVWTRSGTAPVSEGVATRESLVGGKTLVLIGPANPAGQTGWQCEDSAEFSGDQICTTPLTSDHLPPWGNAIGVCTDLVENEKLTQICEETDQPPNAMPTPGSACIPRTRRWCDGVGFCGWGIIECNDDGTWPTTTRLDQYGRSHVIDDCKEHPDGLRPDTRCAQYYWFFNPECCERPDCVIPDGVEGQPFRPSEGNLCDPCSPVDPECKEPGALCVFSLKKIPSELIGGAEFNTGETYCGRECGGNRGCPDGFTCARACAPNFSGPRECGYQCVPTDGASCYLRTQ